MKPSVGQAIVRKDGRLKVTGGARYSADWQVKGLTHAAVIQSSIPSGRVRSFDLSVAKKIPGVIEIITHENAQSIHIFNPLHKIFLGDPEYPFQSDKVFYYGQPIGVVVAESLEAAEQAARVVVVHYKPEEGKLNFAEKIKTDAHKKLYSLQAGKLTLTKGKIEEEIKKSKTILRQTYTIPVENHHPMETSSTIAIFEGDQLKVYDTTQGVSNLHQTMSSAFNISKENTQVITKFLGGGFGCKGSIWSHVFIACLAAKKTKRPVKLVSTRISMSTNVGHRAQTVQDVVLGTNVDGKLLAIKHETVNPTGVNKDYPETTGALFKLLYASPAIQTTQKTVKLNHPIPTFMRAPGEAPGSFALESAMDEMAFAHKMDPVQFRLINYAEKDPIKDIPFSSKSLKECYAKGAQKFGWDKRKPEPGSNRQGDYFIGHGMATSSYPVNAFSTSAKVELSAEGTAIVTSASQDIGTGTYTVMTQLAADALGLAYENVSFDLGDSHYPNAGVSGGSSTVTSLGWAISEASQKVFEKIKELAVQDKNSPLHGAKVKDLEVAEQKVFSKKTPSLNENIFTVMKRNHEKSISGEGDMDGKKQKATAKKYSQHAFGAQFAEVKVHALTGEVTLTRMVGAFAAGKIVNPRTARSQYMGGMIFGIGMGLSEENLVDERYGKFMMRDLGEYHVPVNKDVPELDIVFIDEVDTIVNPAGTKGIGEIGTVGTAAAIANAVFNATGIRIRDLPITPDKLVVELNRRA